MENVCSHKEVTRDPPPLLCRKIFCYAENFLIMQKVFCYAEKLCRKFSCMQTKSFLIMRKRKLTLVPKKKKSLLSMNLLQRQCSQLTNFSFTCNIGSYMQKGKIPDLSQADTSHYQVHKIQPITKHHVLLLGFAITTQKSTEICQVSCKNQSHLSTCKR